MIERIGAFPNNGLKLTAHGCRRVRVWSAAAYPGVGPTLAAPSGAVRQAVLDDRERQCPRPPDRSTGGRTGVLWEPRPYHRHSPCRDVASSLAWTDCGGLSVC